MPEQKVHNNRRKIAIRGAVVQEWRKGKGWSLRDAGRALDISAQAFAYLEEAGAPLVHALAIAAIDAGLQPYFGPRGGFQEISPEDVA